MIKSNSHRQWFTVVSSLGCSPLKDAVGFETHYLSSDYRSLILHKTQDFRDVGFQKQSIS